MKQLFEEVSAILEHDQGNNKTHAEDLARRIVLSRAYGIPVCDSCGSENTEFVRKAGVAVFCKDCGCLVEEK